MNDGYIQVFKVQIGELNKAVSIFSYNSESIFKSNVVEIITIPNDKNNVMVVVKMSGSYPYITNQWKEYIID